MGYELSVGEFKLPDLDYIWENTDIGGDVYISTYRVDG